MAVQINASGDSVKQSISSTTAATIMGWVTLDVDRNDYTNILALGPDNPLIQTEANGTQMALWNGSTFPTGSSFTIGTPAHITLVIDGSTLRAYFNGVLDITSTAGANATELNFGNSTDYPANYLNGRVAYGKAWSAVLTAAEILNEMRTALPRRYANLIGFYPFNTIGNIGRAWIGTSLTTAGTPDLADSPPVPWGAPVQIYPFAAAASGTTFTISPSGSIVFSGGVTNLVRGKAFIPSGSLALSGSAALIKGKVFLPSGNITFNNSATVRRGRVLLPSGLITFSGAAPSLRGRLITPSGQLSFSGTAPNIRGRQFNPAGNIVFSGTAVLARGKIYLPTGQIVFSGSAPLSTGASNSYTISPTGSITFSGAANYLHERVLLPTGTIQFSATVPMLRGRVLLPSGEITFQGGIGNMTKGKIILPSGQVVFSGSAPMIFTPAGAVVGRNINRLNIRVSREIGL